MPRVPRAGRDGAPGSTTVEVLAEDPAPDPAEAGASRPPGDGAWAPSDPGSNPGPPPEAQHRFPCERCGADMRFAPGAEALVCDHCGHTEALAQAAPVPQPLEELDFNAAIEARLPAAETEQTRTTDCPNCGAQVDLGADTQATECPFCATPVVAGTGRHRQIKPRGLLPFTLDETAARGAMTDWLGGLWFAPNGLARYARKGRRMRGVYVPYWTFDAQTASSYRGERGTVYYVTQTVRTKDGGTATRRVPRVRWRPASGRVARFFDDVLVLASRSLPKDHTDALEPWDLSALEPYAPEFLAGFAAEGYQVELREGFAEARARMDRQIARDVKFDIGGDRQRIHRIDTRVSDVTFKHVLLPVWVAAYRYNGKSFRFVVNAQSGKVRGERPWSAWKIALAVVLGASVAAVAGYFYAQAQ